MPPSGTGKRRILFVGEAPGEREDAQGTQFVGKAGQELRKVLARLKFNLNDGVITNASICRPPSNNIEDLHIESCRPNLLKAVREHKPRVIILMGASAVKSLMPTERDASVGTITRWVGWKIPSHEHQSWICPTFHPSYVLRMEDQVVDRMFHDHLKAAIQLEKVPIESPSLEDLKAKVELVRSPRLARLRLRDLARRKGYLAFDYETTGLKPDHPKHRIVSASFCLDGTDTWATMYEDSLRTPLNRVLRSTGLQKIGSNIKFEIRWSLAKLGILPRAWYHDTMLGAHVHDNRSEITSVKFQAFIHFGIADYDAAVEHYFKTDAAGFNRVHECPPDVLMTYNALDSLLEFMVALKQRQLMRYPCPSF